MKNPDDQKKLIGVFVFMNFVPILARNMMKQFYQRLKKQFVLPHVLFWVVAIIFFVVLLFYTRDFRIQELDLQTAMNIFITVLFLAISVYINLLWLIPKYFKKRKFLLFFLFQVGNIILFIVLNYLTSHVFEEVHPSSREEFIHECIAEFILVLLFLIISTLLKFMRDSIALQDAEIKVKEIEKQKIEAELQTLKSQVNPHFFFNTLNSLYSLSLDKSDRAPEMILKLSELMRYVIYEAKDNQVPLTKQLDFIQSYIYLEKARMNDNLQVKFSVFGDCFNAKTDPLLFIAFIENAFKHGAKSSLDNPFIDIQFNLTEEGRIEFSVENNTESKTEKDSYPPGIGLINVQKRLNLLYPGKHLLVIRQTDSVYRVDLKIDVHEDQLSNHR